MENGRKEGMKGTQVGGVHVEFAMGEEKMQILEILIKKISSNRRTLYSVVGGQGLGGE